MPYDRTSVTSGVTTYILERGIREDAISAGVPPMDLDMNEVNRALTTTPEWTDDGFFAAIGGPEVGQWLFDTEPDQDAVDRLDAYLASPEYVAQSEVSQKDAFNALATTDDKLNYLRDTLL